MIIYRFAFHFFQAMFNKCLQLRALGLVFLPGLLGTIIIGCSSKLKPSENSFNGNGYMNDEMVNCHVSIHYDYDICKPDTCIDIVLLVNKKNSKECNAIIYYVPFKEGKTILHNIEPSKRKIGNTYANFLFETKDGFGNFSIQTSKQESYIELTTIDRKNWIVSGILEAYLIESLNPVFLGRDREKMNIRDLKFHAKVNWD